jgi:PAS domain-containing protein
MTGGAAEARRVLDGETTFALEHRMVCKDGSYGWVEWTATAGPKMGSWTESPPT